MELSQIRYFLAVAKTQHVTKAAEELHLAQPALSQAIHRLEKELQVSLFAPNGRNIVLTEYGRFLQEKLQPVIDILDSVPRELNAITNRENSTIHLNVLAASTLVTDAIIQYKRSNANVHFQLLQNSESGLCDIEVTTKPFSPPESSRLPNQFICTERIFLAVPNDPRFQQYESIPLFDAKAENFVSLAGSKQLRYICDSFCAQAGFEPNIIFESDNPAAVKNMIASNIGIGFWPEFTWGNLPKEDIRLLPIESPLCQRNLIVTYNQNKSDDSEVQCFYDFLVDFFNYKKGLQ